VVSAAGIMNTICMAPPYVLLSMARAGTFPAAFGRLHPRLQTPLLGVLGQGLWAVLLLLAVHVLASWRAWSTLDTLAFLCDGVVFVDWLFFMLCGAALLRLRRQHRQGTFRVPGGGWIAALFALAAALVMVGALAQEEYRQPSLLGVGLVALGLPVYFWTLARSRQT
jgi:basic amino acid/polyamine antiporter, APA family